MEKSLTRGEYTLEHSIVEGMFGQPTNFFEVIHVDKDGFRTHYPFIPPFFADKTRDDDLFAIPTYTDEQYEEIFTKELEKYPSASI